MARISDNTFKDWKDGDTVSAAEYMQELEIIRAAVNSTDDDVVLLKNASSGTIKRVPSGTAFPTNPTPAIGDIFYRTDQNKLYVLNSSSQWDGDITQSYAQAVDWAKGYGLGTTAKDIGGTNLNSLSASGFYLGGNMTNAPSQETYFIIHTDGGTNWKSQIAIVYGNSNVVYMRSLNNGVWTSWMQLSDGTRNEAVFAFFYTDGTSATASANVNFVKPFQSKPFVTMGDIDQAVPYSDTLCFPFIYDVTTTGFSVRVTTAAGGKLGTVGSPANMVIKFMATGK